MADDKPNNPPRSRQEIMRDIGAALAERRKTRGLQIEKVAQVLKIRLQFLQALEKGEWNELPGEVYVRGFARRYAQYLGLDGEKLLAPYVTDRPADVAHVPEGDDGAGTETSRTILIAVAIVAVFAIVVLKLARQDKTPGAREAEKPAAAAPAPVSSGPVAVAASSGTVAGVANPDQHQIEVYSPFPLWLRVQASSKTFEGFIPQKSTWTWSDTGRFTVRFGHTRHVSVKFDGSPVTVKDSQSKVDLPE